MCIYRLYVEISNEVMIACRETSYKYTYVTAISMKRLYSVHTVRHEKQR
jgi:hypothetical protein